MPRQNHHSLEPHNHHCFGVTLRDHHGICLGYICQICDLPLVNTVDGTTPAHQLSLEVYPIIYLPRVLYIPGGAECLPSTIFQTKKSKTMISPLHSSEKMPSCMYPGWCKTFQLLSFVGSQPRHFQVKEVNKCSECEWNIFLDE